MRTPSTVLAAALAAPLWLAMLGCPFDPRGIPAGVVQDGGSQDGAAQDAAAADAAPPDAPEPDAALCVPSGPESPPGNPVCADTTDNDCDGTIDDADEACTTYTNDFSSDTQDFSYGGSGWAMGPDVLRTPSCNSTDTEGAFLSGASWGDVVATATVRIEDTCDIFPAPLAGVLARASGAPACPNANGYLCAVNLAGDPNSVTLFRIDVGSCVTSLASTNASALTVNTTYDVELRAVGSALTCTVSGGNLAGPVTVTATDATHAAGTVGFAANDVFARFDDLSATTP